MSEGRNKDHEKLCFPSGVVSCFLGTREPYPGAVRDERALGPELGSSWGDKDLHSQMV